MCRSELQSSSKSGSSSFQMEIIMFLRSQCVNICFALVISSITSSLTRDFRIHFSQLVSAESPMGKFTNLINVPSILRIKSRLGETCEACKEPLGEIQYGRLCRAQRDHSVRRENVKSYEILNRGQVWHGLSFAKASFSEIFILLGCPPTCSKDKDSVR
jgi:hypothetical protein